MPRSGRTPLVFALAACSLLAGCGTPGSISLPSLAGSSARPVNNLSKYEYPFDADGNYIESWAAEGERKYARTTTSRPSRSSRSSAATSSRSTTTSRARSSSSSSARYHTVRRGDTLYGLARRYSSSVSSIKRANGLSSDIIRDGQRLRIP